MSTLVTFFALLVNVLSQLKFPRLMMAPEAPCSSLSNGPGYGSCLSGHELNFPFILLPYKLYGQNKDFVSLFSTSYHANVDFGRLYISKHFLKGNIGDQN